MTFDTSTSTYNDIYLGESTVSSIGDQAVATYDSVWSIVGMQSPDDSTNISLDAFSDATALGAETFTVAAVTGTADDSGSTATINAELTAVAISEAEDETAFAEAITVGYVSDGVESFAITTVESTETHQGPTGSTSIAISSTSVTASDLDPWGDVGGFDAGGWGDALIDDAPVEPDFTGASPVVEDQAESNASWTDEGAVDLIDGNTAYVFVDFAATAGDSFVLVDAYNLVIEGDASISSALVFADISA